jgi:hypothetical protein
MLLPHSNQTSRLNVVSYSWWRVGLTAIVISELLDSEVDVASVINVLDLFGRLLVVPDVDFIVDGVAQSIDLSIESFFDLLLSLN